MPIDPRIALGVQPMQLPMQDPAAGMNALLRATQIGSAMDAQKLNSLQFQEAQRTLDRRNKLDTLLGGYTGKPEELGPTLLRGGFLDEAGKVEKDRREAEKSAAEANFKRIETAHKTVELTGQTMGWLRQNPTLENATAALDHLVTVGGMPKEHAQQVLTTLQANPAGVASFADMVFRSALQAKDQLPKYDTRNLGGSTQTTATDPVTGQLRVVNSVANTQSPDNAATNARAAADAAASRRQAQAHFDATQAAGKLHYDAERGGLVNLQTGEFKPATQGGQPLGPKDKNLTEGQAKANLFGTRMQEAEKVLGTMATAGVNRPGTIKGIAETVGNIAGLGTESMGGALSDAAGTLTNWTQSAEQQQVEQAQRDFINADLRRESGASIAPHEFRNAKNQYFPQPNDDAATLALKARNRQIAIQGILAEVPENKRVKVAPQGSWEGDKEKRYQEWKARQGK